LRIKLFFVTEGKEFILDEEKTILKNPWM